MPNDIPDSILIIEDNPGDFAIVEDFLAERMPYCRLTHAETFRQAQQLLNNPSHHFDIALLDLSLPDRSGQDLVSGMLTLASTCPIIILTGYEDLKFSISTINQGIADYLLKDELNAGSLFKSIIYSVSRKKTLLELLESERRYSELFHYSPQPMYVYDPVDLRFQQINNAGLVLYGYSEEEFLKMHLPDLRMEPLDDRELAMIRNAGDSMYSRLVRHRKKSGELIDVEIHSAPLVIDGRLLRSVIAIDVTEKIRFEQTLSRAIIKAQEDERYEIGSELHDNVCQILATSNLGLKMIRDNIPDDARPLFNQSQEAITLASKEIRKLSHRLAPAFYESRTLREEFEILLHTFNLEHTYQIDLSFDPGVIDRHMSTEVKLSLYRILQEQLKNIYKYARGNRITIKMQAPGQAIRMTIADNGVGFNIDRVVKGIGIANMRRRATLCGGSFDLVSAPGEGCSIVVTIPLR